MVNLKPCPFCGGKANGAVRGGYDERDGYAQSYGIQCTSCGASIQRHGSAPNGRGYADNSTIESDAIQSWNNRKELTE